MYQYLHIDVNKWITTALFSPVFLGRIHWTGSGGEAEFVMAFVAGTCSRIVQWGMTHTVERPLLHYCKRAILFLLSSKILTPHPPLRPVSVYPPAFVAGGGQTGRAERRGGMGGSIFWKTREIGLPSYSKICTLWLIPKEVIKEQPTPTNLSATARRVLHCTRSQ